VITAYKAGGYAVAMGKIKSQWGDADFTSAPMNVGFTLLALLHKGTDFSCVLDALHLGHDSDCISATAGALVGIICGYEAVSDTWKRRVGNELLLSSEITGIAAPTTLTALAEQTCRAGLSFIDHYGTFERVASGRTGTWPEPFPVEPSRFALWLTKTDAGLRVRYENLTNDQQDVALTVRAGVNQIEAGTLQAKLRPAESVASTLPPIPTAEHGLLAETYLIDVVINNQPVAQLQRGFPRYGSWLLLGPFIQDDPALLPLDPTYPDHGLASMPSARYMNHDRVNRDTDFLTVAQVRTYARERADDTYPFGITEVRPDEFRIDLPRYYQGRGERTLYLYSRLCFNEPTRLWVSMGCTAPFRLWLNGEVVHTQTEVRRTWPGQTTVEYTFPAGESDILLKIDTVTDEPRLEIGFKEHLGKHPHQSQWALVVPTI
jgi:hypothetical protein